MAARQWGNDSFTQDCEEYQLIKRLLAAYPNLTAEGETPINPFTGTSGAIRKLINSCGRFKKNSFDSGVRRLRSLAKDSLRASDFRLYEQEEGECACKPERSCFIPLCLRANFCMVACRACSSKSYLGIAHLHYLRLSMLY